jgi:hypothetical protein
VETRRFFDSLETSQNALFESVGCSRSADLRERNAENSQNSSISSISSISLVQFWFRQTFSNHSIGGGGGMAPFNAVDVVVAVEKVGFYGAICQRLKPLPELKKGAEAH